MILQLMKSLYAHDVIDVSVVVGVLAVVIFGKKLVSKSKIWYPMNLFDIWILQTATCQKLVAKLLRYVFANHEIEY